MSFMETKLQRFERLKITLNEIESLIGSQNALVLRYDWSVRDIEYIKEKIGACEHKISNLLPDQMQLPENVEGSAIYDEAGGLDIIRSQIKNLENQCSELEAERKNINRELPKKHNEFGGRTYSEFMKFKKIEQSIKKDMAVYKNKIREVLIGIVFAGLIGVLLLVVPLFILDYNPELVIAASTCLWPVIFLAGHRFIFPMVSKSKKQVLAKVSKEIENEMEVYDSTISKHMKNERRAKKISSILKKNKKLIHSLDKKNKKFMRSFDQLREEKSNLYDELNQKISEIEDTLNSLVEVETEIKNKYDSISKMIPSG